MLNGTVTTMADALTTATALMADAIVSDAEMAASEVQKPGNGGNAPEAPAPKAQKTETPKTAQNKTAPKVEAPKIEKVKIFTSTYTINDELAKDKNGKTIQPIEKTGLKDAYLTSMNNVKHLRDTKDLPFKRGGNRGVGRYWTCVDKAGKHHKIIVGETMKTITVK